MLCQTCQKIFRGSCAHKEYNHNHHIYVYQLERAAFELCHVCQVIWRGISDRPPTIAKEAFEAPPEEEAFTTKPISKYRVEHRSSRSRDNNHNNSELSFVVDKNGVDSGGRSFTFCLQPMGSMTMPLVSILWY